VRGNNVKVCGGLGALLVIGIEKSSTYDLEEWMAIVVDGEKVKANVWHTLKDGELIECV
jgi:hypothetical protein